MALTRKVELILEQKRAVEYFNQHRARFMSCAERAYNQTKENLPATVPIRQDDVANALKLQLEVDEALREFQIENGMRAERYVFDFSHLVIDRCWSELDDSDQETNERFSRN